MNYEYDNLHRLKKKKHGTTVVAEYAYDGTSGNNAIGRLITEHDGPAGSSNKVDYTYDPVGRVKNANRTVSSTTYNMAYAYDLMGNLDTLDYPSSSGTRRKVQYAYKSGTGEMDKVSDITGTAFDYVSGTTYSNLGPLATLSLNNTVTTTLGWNKRGLIIGIFTQKSGSTTHLDLDYTYFTNGQINEIINALNSLKSEKYTYDDLLRLATAQRGPDSNIQRKYSYDYDRFGNRWAQTVTAGSGLGGTNTFNYGSNRVTTSGFTYDTSGNITANASVSSLSYNQENGLTSVGASISYVFDAQGRRVRKTVSGTVTDYFYAGAVVIAEKAGSTWTDYIFFSGERIAKQTGSSLTTTTFLHTDHLGSTRVCTNSSGSSAGTCDYEPFGEVQPGTTCSIPTNFRFAGMEWDSETGLYHTLFRQYDVNQGRWMSVDPLAGYEDDPQTVDRYVYARNDPVNLSDPLGLDVYLWIGNCLYRGSIQVVNANIIPDEGGGESSTPSSTPPTINITLHDRIGCIIYDGWGPYPIGGTGGGTPTDDPGVIVRRIACPEVPPAPQGVNVNSNIAQANQKRLDNINSRMVFRTRTWFKNQVQTGGPWDYKQQGQAYEPFGNFNYGATGRAAGFDLGLLLRAAGAVHMKNAIQSGNWHPSFGWPLGSFPYGDDPRDQRNIIAGYTYSLNSCNERFVE